jgi:hypothetical protein
MSGFSLSIEFFFGMLKSLTDLFRLRMSREAQLVGERRLRHLLKESVSDLDLKRWETGLGEMTSQKYSDAYQRRGSQKGLVYAFAYLVRKEMGDSFGLEGAAARSAGAGRGARRWPSFSRGRLMIMSEFSRRLKGADSSLSSEEQRLS